MLAPRILTVGTGTRLTVPTHLRLALSQSRHSRLIPTFSGRNLREQALGFAPLFEIDAMGFQRIDRSGASGVKPCESRVRRIGIRP